MDVDLCLVLKVMAAGAACAGLLFAVLWVLTFPDDWEYHEGDDGPGND